MIYTVRTSNDGLQNVAFTNVKALYDFLTKEFGLTSQRAKIRKEEKWQYGAFTYSNLLASVNEAKKNDRFCACQIEDTELDSIEIDCIAVVTKW